MIDRAEILSIKEGWIKLKAKLEAQFGEIPDLETVLFLIGVQELGKGLLTFTKDQKMDLMHIAICKVLSKYGFYEFEFIDEDGWPHWKVIKDLPHMDNKEQDLLLKKAIVAYFADAT